MYFKIRTILLKISLSLISRGAKLVDPNPEIERELKAEMDKVAKIYGGGSGVDLTKFPTFNFTEPKVDPIVEK